MHAHIFKNMNSLNRMKKEILIYLYSTYKSKHGLIKITVKS